MKAMRAPSFGREGEFAAWVTDDGGLYITHPAPSAKLSEQRAYEFAEWLRATYVA